MNCFDVMDLLMIVGKGNVCGFYWINCIVSWGCLIEGIGILNIFLFLWLEVILNFWNKCKYLYWKLSLVFGELIWYINMVDNVIMMICKNFLYLII